MADDPIPQEPQPTNWVRLICDEVMNRFREQRLRGNYEIEDFQHLWEGGNRQGQQLMIWYAAQRRMGMNRVVSQQEIGRIVNEKVQQVFYEYDGERARRVAQRERIEELLQQNRNRLQAAAENEARQAAEIEARLQHEQLQQQAAEVQRLHNEFRQFEEEWIQNRREREEREEREAREARQREARNQMRPPPAILPLFRQLLDVRNEQNVNGRAQRLMGENPENEVLNLERRRRARGEENRQLMQRIRNLQNLQREALREELQRVREMRELDFDEDMMDFERRMQRRNATVIERQDAERKEQAEKREADRKESVKKIDLHRIFLNLSKIKRVIDEQRNELHARNDPGAADFEFNPQDFIEALVAVIEQSGDTVNPIIEQLTEKLEEFEEKMEVDKEYGPEDFQLPDNIRNGLTAREVQLLEASIDHIRRSVQEGSQFPGIGQFHRIIDACQTYGKTDELLSEVRLKEVVEEIVKTEDFRKRARQFRFDKADDRFVEETPPVRREPETETLYVPYIQGCEYRQWREQDVMDWVKMFIKEESHLKLIKNEGFTGQTLNDFVSSPLDWMARGFPFGIYVQLKSHLNRVVNTKNGFKYDPLLSEL